MCFTIALFVVHSWILITKVRNRESTPYTEFPCLSLTRDSRANFSLHSSDCEHCLIGVHLMDNTRSLYHPLHLSLIEEYTP